MNTLDIRNTGLIPNQILNVKSEGGVKEPSGSGLPDASDLPDGTALIAVDGEWTNQEGYGYDNGIKKDFPQWAKDAGYIPSLSFGDDNPLSRPHFNAFFRIGDSITWPIDILNKIESGDATEKDATTPVMHFRAYGENASDEEKRRAIKHLKHLLFGGYYYDVDESYGDHLGDADVLHEREWGLYLIADQPTGLSLHNISAEDKFPWFINVTEDNVHDLESAFDVSGIELGSYVKIEFDDRIWKDRSFMPFEPCPNVDYITLEIGVPEEEIRDIHQIKTKFGTVDAPSSENEIVVDGYGWTEKNAQDPEIIEVFGEIEPVSWSGDTTGYAEEDTMVYNDGDFYIPMYRYLGNYEDDWISAILDYWDGNKSIPYDFIDGTGVYSSDFPITEFDYIDDDSESKMFFEADGIIIALYLDDIGVGHMPNHPNPGLYFADYRTIEGWYVSSIYPQAEDIVHKIDPKYIEIETRGYSFLDGGDLTVMFEDNPSAPYELIKNLFEKNPSGVIKIMDGQMEYTLRGVYNDEIGRMVFIFLLEEHNYVTTDDVTTFRKEVTEWEMGPEPDPIDWFMTQLPVYHYIDFTTLEN